MSLKGAPELRRRLRAIRTVFKPAGREWADETTRIAKRLVRVKTGKTRSSIRRRNASQRLASVVGNYPVNFIDAGVKAHTIEARKMKALKFASGGATYFRRKVHKPRQGAHPFKRQAAQEGLEKVGILNDLIELWNRAA